MGQIRSKKRVKDLAEVFTNEREVNAMLDLVKEESYRVRSRFLEPACGSGNFLVKILERKLQSIEKMIPALSTKEIEYNVILALTKIYGIDISRQNVEESRQRMLDIVVEWYSEMLLEDSSDDFMKSAEYILDVNIVLGNTLDPGDLMLIDFTECQDMRFIKKWYRFADLTCDSPKPEKNDIESRKYDEVWR